MRMGRHERPARPIDPTLAEADVLAIYPPLVEKEGVKWAAAKLTCRGACKPAVTCRTGD